MNRKSIELYPDYTSELEELKTNGLSLELLYRIIKSTILIADITENFIEDI